MNSDRFKMFIDGKWCDADSGETIDVVNPATEETTATIPYGSKAEALRALDSAQQAFTKWSRLTVLERAGYLRRITEIMRDRLDESAEIMTREMGKPLAEAKAEIGGAAATFEWYAEEARRVYGAVIPAGLAGRRHLTIKQPIGVCVAIAPWNFPCVLPTRKISAALAAGCSIVMKPAQDAPLSTMAIAQCIEDAGVPPGVMNVVTGKSSEVVETLVSSPITKKVSLTGSSEVGSIVLRQAADGIKKTSMELGGDAPAIVFEDADLDKAVQQILIGKFRNNGQVCIAINRIFIHENVYDAFMEKFLAGVKNLVVGNGMDANTTIGPMANVNEYEKITKFLADAVDKGATVLCGGKRPKGFDKGYFFEPTVIENLHAGMKICCSEVFGPIAPVQKFRDFDEVMALANNTVYGLAGYFFTRDLSTTIKAYEQMETGMVGVNCVGLAMPEAPFGGIKQSGFGKEGSFMGLEDYMITKYVTIEM
jgi:succinate-semialdehyde dehydrogenase / glutarate-semialdehyde dehydrogenase